MTITTPRRAVFEDRTGHTQASLELWDPVITTKEDFYTVVMTVSRQANVVDSVPSWNLLMAMAMLAMLPPVLVVVFMQRQFVRGLVETEK